MKIRLPNKVYHFNQLRNRGRIIFELFFDRWRIFKKSTYIHLPFKKPILLHHPSQNSVMITPVHGDPWNWSLAATQKTPVFRSEISARLPISNRLTSLHPFRDPEKTSIVELRICQKEWLILVVSFPARASPQAPCREGDAEVNFQARRPSLHILFFKTNSEYGCIAGRELFWHGNLQASGALTPLQFLLASYQFNRLYLASRNTERMKQ